MNSYITHNSYTWLGSKVATSSLAFQGRNMASSSKKVFEVFVSKIPWTIASSKHAFFKKYIYKYIWIGNKITVCWQFYVRLWAFVGVFTSCCVSAALTLLLTMCGCVFQLTLFEPTFLSLLFASMLIWHCRCCRLQSYEAYCSLMMWVMYVNEIVGISWLAKTSWPVCIVKD